MKYAVMLLLFGNACFAQTAKVLGITGEWKWAAPRGDEPLALAAPVPLPSKVKGDHGGTLFLECPAGPPQSLHCDRPKCEYFACQGSLLADVSPDAKGLFAALLAAFQRRPPRLAAAIARAIDVPEEAVVKINDHTLELGPAFREVSAGTLKIGLSREGEPMKVVNFQWDGSGSGSVTIPGLTKGIYYIDLLQDSGKPTNTMVWVLAVPSDQFQNMTTAFEQRKSEIAKLEKSTGPAIAQTWRRAILLSLFTPKG